MTRRESTVENVAQCDLQMTDWLSERRGDRRVPAVHLDRRREVAVAVSEIGAQPLGAEEAFEVGLGDRLRRTGHW